MNSFLCRTFQLSFSILKLYLKFVKFVKKFAPSIRKYVIEVVFSSGMLNILYRYLFFHNDAGTQLTPVLITARVESTTGR